MIRLWRPTGGILGSSSSTVPPPYLSVVWDTPTPEPGLNTKNQPVISGGMPVGNGETVRTIRPALASVARSRDPRSTAGSAQSRRAVR